MALNGHPVLCGGTFFTLLLAACNRKLNKRDVWGENNLFTEADVLERLILIAHPTYSKPDDNANFASVVSAYKSCNTAKSGRLGIFEQAIISTFDSKVKSDYRSKLSEMTSVVTEYVDVDGKGEWLVKALLELIDIDEIDDESEFFIQVDGDKKTKADLRYESDFCLPAFLLGIWHFIVTTRKDNAAGKATYDDWCKQGGSKNTRLPFQSDIGKGIVRTLTITMEPETKTFSDKTSADEPYDTPPPDDYFYYEKTEAESPKPPPNVYVQNVVQKGDHNINIGFQLNVN